MIFIFLLAAANVFTLDSKKSELVVKTKKAGVASGLAHNHVIRASEVAGEMTWDDADLSAVKVSVTVQVGSLIVDDPALRKKHGETSEVSEADRKKVTEAMLSSDQLDAKQFPTITFVSSVVSKDSKGFVVSGTLALHGVKKSVQLPVTIAVKDGVLVGHGQLQLRTSDYGIKPFSTALGMVKNHDEVELVLELVGSR